MSFSIPCLTFFVADNRRGSASNDQVSSRLKFVNSRSYLVLAFRRGFRLERSVPMMRHGAARKTSYGNAGQVSAYPRDLPAQHLPSREVRAHGESTWINIAYYNIYIHMYVFFFSKRITNLDHKFSWQLWFLYKRVRLFLRYFCP